MSPIVYRMNGVLSHVVQRAPVGTNLGLFHLLWMLLSGRLLLSRGAVIPGLAALGLAAEAVRRAWAALAYGKWHAAQLLEAWEQLVREEQAFHAHQYGGYRPVACDLVGFFRPRLQDCSTKHYSSTAGKALPAIPLGIAARVGTVGTQRLAVPCLLVRGEPTDTSETDLQTRLLQRANERLAATKRWSAIGDSPSASSRPPGFNAMSSALPSTLRRGGRPSPRIKGRGANPSAVRLSAPSHARTRGAPLPRHPRTATKPGSSVSGPPPCRCTRRFGTTWYAPMRNRARQPSAPYSSMIRVLTSHSS